MPDVLFIGLMSGTSLDGVDVVIVDFPRNHHPQVLHNHFLPYSQVIRTQILSLQHPTENELETTALLSNALARLYADAVNQLLISSKISPNQITAIGCHGQTIRHKPGFSDGIGFTLQIVNAALLSELTNITVVSDFRSRDIAAGGQGAPLVPAFHQAVFANPKKNRAIVNIGGIANITFISKSGEVLGFDSGPGNMLIDSWTKLHLGKNFDANGEWASTGVILSNLLFDMLAEPYFALPPPKSTGRDLFNDDWLKQHLIYPEMRSEDIARTLVELTSQTIQQSIVKTCADIDEVYLCGGGAHNTLLKNCLQNLLGDIKVETTDCLGISVDWLEAVAFAWLAKLCLNKETANLPEVTGAKGTRILGAIYQN